VLITVVSTGVILRSTDAGATWQTIASGTRESLRAPVLDPASGALLIAGRGGVVLRSVDDGLSWTQVDTHSTARFKRVFIDPGSKSLFAHGDRLVRLDPAP
jgi:hypothetical protein